MNGITEDEINNIAEEANVRYPNTLFELAKLEQDVKQVIDNVNKRYIELQSKYKLTPSEERAWKKTLDNLPKNVEIAYLYTVAIKVIKRNGRAIIDYLIQKGGINAYGLIGDGDNGNIYYLDKLTNVINHREPHDVSLKKITLEKLIEICG